MKLIIALGGLIGFAIGLGFSWAQGHPWPAALGRAVIATLIAGLLSQWWGRLWIRCLRQSHRERQTALKKLESSPQPNPAKK